MENLSQLVARLKELFPDAGWLVRSVEPEEGKAENIHAFAHVNSGPIRGSSGGLVGFKLSAPVWGETPEQTLTDAINVYIDLRYRSPN